MLDGVKMEARSLIKFKDLDEPDDIHFGIIFNDDRILCLCCGGWVELGHYEIIEDYNGFEYLEETLKEYF